MKRHHHILITLATCIFWFAPTQSNGAQVGYCAGPPLAQYEHASCSTHDNDALIAKSRVVSGSPNFCARLMKSHWSYFPLDLDQTVTRDEAQQFLSVGGALAVTDPNAGFFDINNDGHPEYLGRLQDYSGAGQGCDIEIFVEMNPERTHLQRSALSALLGTDTKCGNYPRPFRYENKTYIENRKIVKMRSLNFMLPNVLTEVYIFEGNKRRSVCTFALSE